MKYCNNCACEYDDFGNLLKLTQYDKGGNLSGYITYEYSE